MPAFFAPKDIYTLTYISCYDKQSIFPKLFYRHKLEYLYPALSGHPGECPLIHNQCAILGVSAHVSCIIDAVFLLQLWHEKE